MIAYNINFTIQYDKNKKIYNKSIDGKNLKSVKKKIENKISKQAGKRRHIQILDYTIVGYY